MARDFNGDPLGWAGNQAGHFCIGMSLTFFQAVCGFWIFGEFHHRWISWFIVAGFYAVVIEWLAWVVILKQWRGWKDTIEDWWFCAIYGSWIPLAASYEAKPGTLLVVFDFGLIFTWLVILYCHVALGMWVRRQRRSE